MQVNDYNHNEHVPVFAVVESPDNVAHYVHIAPAPLWALTRAYPLAHVTVPTANGVEEPITQEVEP